MHGEPWNARAAGIVFTCSPTCRYTQPLNGSCHGCRGSCRGRWMQRGRPALQGPAGAQAASGAGLGQQSRSGKSGAGHAGPGSPGALGARCRTGSQHGPCLCALRDTHGPVAEGPQGCKATLAHSSKQCGCWGPVVVHGGSTIDAIVREWGHAVRVELYAPEGPWTQNRFLRHSE